MAERMLMELPLAPKILDIRKEVVLDLGYKQEHCKLKDGCHCKLREECHSRLRKKRIVVVWFECLQAECYFVLMAVMSLVHR